VCIQYLAPKYHLRIPEPRPIIEKNLPELASINPHDPGIWAYVLITEWLNYYKRVTFLSVHMPGHRREFGSIPELMPVTKKDLPGLASVQASMTQAFGLLGPMCSSLNDLNYYKRVTFLSVHMPGHCREFGSFPELTPLTKKDLPDLASINAHDPGNWAIWAYVCGRQLRIFWRFN